MTNAKRLEYLNRSKAHLQKAIDILEQGEQFASDDNADTFLDHDLKNSLECAMEDVDNAIENLDEVTTTSKQR